MAEDRGVALPGRGGVLYGLVGGTEAEGPVRGGGGQSLRVAGGLLDLGAARGDLASAGGLELLERRKAVGAGVHLGGSLGRGRRSGRSNHCASAALVRCSR